jgi:hypothetical protein
MNDLEQRLESTLKGMGDAHAEAVGADIPRLRSDVLGRVRRRKVVRGVAYFAVAAAVVGAAVLAWPSDVFDRAEPAPPAGPDQGRAVTEYIALGNLGGLSQHIASTDAGIYVAGNDYLHHIDPATNKVETLYEHPRYETGQEHCCMDLSGFGGNLWRVVTIGSHPGAMIQAVDLETGEAKMSQAGSASAGSGETDIGEQKVISVGPEFGWSIDPADPVVHMMDLQSLSTIDGYEFEGSPRLVSSWEDTAYVVGGDATTERVFWFKAGLGSTQSFNEWETGCLEDIAAGPDGLFAIDDCENRLAWVAPDITERAVVYADLPSEGSAVALGLGSVWVTHEESDSVSRFIASESDGEHSLEFVEAVPVDDVSPESSFAPVDIVGGAGAMWVANSDASAVTKITIDYGSDEPTVAPTESDVEPEPTESEDLEQSASEEEANFAAVWPEHIYEDAVEVCEAEAIEPWRTEPNLLAREFGQRVAIWPEVTSSARPDLSNESVTTVEIQDSSNPSARILVNAYELRSSCWFVSGLHVPQDYEEKDTDGSMSVSGRDVSVSWPRRGAATFSIRIEYQKGNKVVMDSAESFLEEQLAMEPSATGYILILYKDVEGRTVGALGFSLPAGDFAAG